MSAYADLPFPPDTGSKCPSHTSGRLCTTCAQLNTRRIPQTPSYSLKLHPVWPAKYNLTACEIKRGTYVALKSKKK